MGAVARTKASRESVWPEANGRPGTPDANQPRQALDPRLQSVIGDHLRTYYADLLREPVPDRFLDLMKQLGTAKGSKA